MSAMQRGSWRLCILMVEDEALILEIMAETLVDAGYDVAMVGDGAEAMALINEGIDRFSALFSDYHLPGGVTGLDLAMEMRARHPSIPVILATGRPDVLVDRWPSEAGFVLLRKPYGASQMVGTVGKLVRPHR